MVNINSYVGVTFKRCENKECIPLSEPKDVFYEAYSILEEPVVRNQKINIYASIPQIPWIISAEKYEEHAKKFRGRYIVELQRNDGATDRYVVSLRRDRDLYFRFRSSSFLTKIPAALLLISENDKSNILVLREARLYTPNSYVFKGEDTRQRIIVRSLDDVVGLLNPNAKVKGLTSEYISMLVPEWHQLDFLVASDAYRPAWRDVELAFLYIRGFYQLLEDSEKDLGEEVYGILKKLFERQIKTGIILADQKPNQFSADGKITDPELVAIAPNQALAASILYVYGSPTEFVSMTEGIDMKYIERWRKILNKTVSRYFKNKKVQTTGPRLLYKRLREVGSLEKVPGYLKTLQFDPK